MLNKEEVKILDEFKEKIDAAKLTAEEMKAVLIFMQGLEIGRVLSH